MLLTPEAKELNAADHAAVINKQAPIDHSEYRERAYAAGKNFLAEVDKTTADIRTRRHESEKQGKVSDLTVQAMIKAGLFRTFTPLQYGGLEMDPASFFEGIMKIAQADSAAAWIAGQLNVHSFEIALMDKRMQDEFWADGPDTRASSSYAPIGKWQALDGGYRLNGTWTFSSGVDHAQWVIIGGGDRSFVVPIRDVVIDHSSWDVQGLKGTGSKSVTLQEVFVPEYRCHKFMDTLNDQNPGWAVNDRPLYRLSFMGLFNATATNTIIGTGLEGLRIFMEQSKVRLTRQGTGAPIANNPFMHLKLADGLTRINGVRNRHLANWRDFFDKACHNEPISTLDRMRARFESADANATCFDVIHDIWPIAGAAASASNNDLQQVYRDLMAGRNHGSAGKELAAGLYIKALFDMPPPEFSSIDMGTLAYYK